MKVVTAVTGFIDIDGYGGCVAYAELLNLQGQPAIAASTSVWNESITPTIRAWGSGPDKTYQPTPEDEFVLVDMCNPEDADKLVDQARITEVIDHRVGFEQYWQERIGDKARIEQVGAACTLVCEQWQAAGLLDKMSQTSARLLICGILDNTLNFGAGVTTKRDKRAYQALLSRANLPEDWPAQYFRECEQTILRDVPAAVKSDTREPWLQTAPSKPAVGQLVVWDGAQVWRDHQAVITATLSGINPHWFLNIVSIGEGCSYLVCEDPPLRDWLAKLLGVTFDGAVAKADRLWLRKEILARDQAVQK